jgi:hypothetical protein
MVLTKEEKEYPLIDKFLFHMFDIKDVDYLILKGHILTEHSLHFFIEMTSVEKINFEKVKFSYSNKIEIAKTLGLFINNKKLYSELKLLNKLRNSIAHKLKYDEKLFADFIKGFEPYKDYFQSENFKKLNISADIFKEQENGIIPEEGKLNMSMLYISTICMKIFSEGARMKKDK